MQGYLLTVAYLLCELTFRMYTPQQSCLDHPELVWNKNPDYYGQ
jgi:hypothetical protein